MLRLMCTLVVLAGIALAGCSSKSNPATSNTPPPVRVVAQTPGSAPSLTDPSAAVWSGVTATPIAISYQNAAKIAPGIGGSLSALSDSVFMQVLRFHDSLYLRLRWHDATHDMRRGAFFVHDTMINCGQPRTCVNMVRDTDTYKEDQALILFDGMPNGEWDALAWRSLTTSVAGFAKGGVYQHDTLVHGDTLTPYDTLVWDNGTLEVAFDNTDQFGLPLVMHKDSSLFHGNLLYLGDPETVNFDIQCKGWAIGQMLPGYYIDSAVIHKDVATRGSRWDTQAASSWDTTTQMYTIMLCRPMNTTFVDDLDLAGVDSVQVKVGLFDNYLDLNVASSDRRGYTKPFWLILR